MEASSRSRMLQGSSNSFSREQWIVLTVIGSVHFGCAICISLQAPFYPAEAEKKGASATEYGLVFGIFELTCFLASPIMGHHIYRTGPKIMLNSGIFVASTCSIFFGIIDVVNDHTAFVTLSFVIRIIEAVGTAAATTAAFALTAAIFPDSVATTFATLEIFYGLGYIVGPLIGGVLYSFGGYVLPFVVMGLFLMVAAVVIYFILPPLVEKENRADGGGSLFAMVKVPDILLDSFCIVATAISMGFYSATLEPHLRMFQLTPMFTAVVFVISGTTYAVSAPFVGRLCDNRVQPKNVMVIGSFFIMLSYFLVGPLPGLPLPKTLWMCILALIVHGVGNASILVPCFTDILMSAIKWGFPNDLSTFGMVSGIWASAFSLGAFIGPSVAGILYDAVGFRCGTLFPVAVHLSVFVCTICFILMRRRRSRQPYEVPPMDPETTFRPQIQLVRNLPQDIPPLSSKSNDSIRPAGYGSLPTGYGSFGTPSSFLSLVR